MDKLVNNEHLSENVNMCSLLSERQVSEPELECQDAAETHLLVRQLLLPIGAVG